MLAGFVSYPLNKILGKRGDRPVAEKSYAEMFVVQGFTVTEVPSIVLRSAQITGILAPLIAISVVMQGFKVTDVPSIVIRSAQIPGILAPLIAISVVMQQILSLLGAQATIGDFVTSMGGYHAVLFTSMIIVFVSGMVLESLPVTIILAPILAPIAASVGVDPIHFSVIFLVGASIGFITPPYGLTL